MSDDSTHDHNAPAPPQPWGAAGCSAWLPEVANASLVAFALVWTYSSRASRFTDSQIQGSLVDTYEVSSWGFTLLCALAVGGIAAAFLTRVVAQSVARKRLAVLQIAVLLGCILVAGWQHHVLMGRTTALTGQRFEGFP